MNRYALDLSRHHSRHAHGDITAYLTWWLAGDTPSPVLVLTPTHARPTHERITPCVVPLGAAWLWAEETGSPAHCARTAYEFARNLGLTAENPITGMRIVSIIRGHLGDLLAMPPMPAERRVVADAIMTDANGRQTHSEIMERV